MLSKGLGIIIVTGELFAKVRNLPFDRSTGSRLRVNGLRLKLFSLSVRGELVEPQKNTFARGSILLKKSLGVKLLLLAVLDPKLIQTH